ncbi:MAG: IS701 family transposase, partial [Flavobacteriales bacterium]|nr:IS701 family transposase [Flavobacteriales bacterium]
MINLHMDIENLLQIYQEGLMASYFQVTCTGLSDITDNVISHDKFTRLLSSGFVNEKHVWKQAKVICQELVDNEAVFIVDDSIQAKPYTDESELICWHYDHVSGKT